MARLSQEEFLQLLSQAQQDPSMADISPEAWQYAPGIAYTESRFDPSAKSPVGAQGIMQLMPDTAKEMGVGDTSDPMQNIMGGVKYLDKMLKQFNFDPEDSIGAYNAGPGNMKKYGGWENVPFPETKNYVPSVLSYTGAPSNVGGQLAGAAAGQQYTPDLMGQSLLSALATGKGPGGIPSPDTEFRETPDDAAMAGRGEEGAEIPAKMQNLLANLMGEGQQGQGTSAMPTKPTMNLPTDTGVAPTKIPVPATVEGKKKGKFGIKDLLPLLFQFGLPIASGAVLGGKNPFLGPLAGALMGATSGGASYLKGKSRDKLMDAKQSMQELKGKQAIQRDVYKEMNANERANAKNAIDWAKTTIQSGDLSRKQVKDQWDQRKDLADLNRKDRELLWEQQVDKGKQVLDEKKFEQGKEEFGKTLDQKDRDLDIKEKVANKKREPTGKIRILSDLKDTSGGKEPINVDDEDALKAFADQLEGLGFDGLSYEDNKSPWPGVTIEYDYDRIKKLAEIYNAL